MRLRALLETDTLGLRLLSGEAELERWVSGVMTTDLRDPRRYLSGGELVLTGLAWRHRPEHTEPFVRHLVEAGVAALAAGEAEIGPVPPDVVAACARHRLPLFAVAEDVAFATVTEHVLRQVSGARITDLAAVVDRHRRLVSAGPAGGGPEAVLDLLGSDLGLRAWVLSPTGRPIAGPSDHCDPAASSAVRRSTSLPAPVREQLASDHLAAIRTGARGPYRTAVDGTTYSLFPVHSGRRPRSAADLRRTVPADWLLAVEADTADWPAQRLDLLRDVSQLIATERDRREAARTVRRQLAQEVLELLGSGAPPAEVATRLRMAAPVLPPEADTAPHWQIVVARVAWRDGDGDGDRPAGGPVAPSLLEEILTDLDAPGPEPCARVAVAQTDEEAVALVLHPVPAGGGASPADTAPHVRRPEREQRDAGDTGSALRATALQASFGPVLSRGLADGTRLSLGVSAVVPSAEGLRGALEQARHARRVAAARPGRVRAAGHEELASYVLLLPFVPDDVRRAFTARLLDPLHDYDRRHRAELVATLEAFLDHDGSWTRCAARLRLHVNTLRYRVARIERLTDRDLSRLEDRVDFFLALRMR